ncbi:CLUMA_CG018543, isoform A [Clunio marinus]|uniref:CLUMA_CG018543, isoform A n=1 Tax=Clunio marinus TaxID=568069 RepID=A0A1J1IY20_9DIPT|nr:CLUMA_CG018543, isoform A [Clunio marinus]
MSSTDRNHIAMIHPHFAASSHQFQCLMLVENHIEQNERKFLHFFSSFSSSELFLTAADDVPSPTHTTFGQMRFNTHKPVSKLKTELLKFIAVEVFPWLRYEHMLRGSQKNV